MKPTPISQSIPASGLDNRFSEHFTTYVFRRCDRNHTLLLDLLNAACDHRPDPQIRGRFTSFTLNPELTRVFYRRERTWLAVGQGMTDQKEQATVVLQFFKYPTFDLSYFMIDYGQLQSVCTITAGSGDFGGGTAQRPIVIISLLKEAMYRWDCNPDWHQLINITWDQNKTPQGIVHRINGRKMDEQAESLPDNRLRLWMDFFCRRDPDGFESRIHGDPVFTRLISLERRFCENPRLMQEYLKTEELCRNLEERLNPGPLHEHQSDVSGS